jgi:hypothetical protein
MKEALAKEEKRKTMTLEELVKDKEEQEEIKRLKKEGKMNKITKNIFYIFKDLKKYLVKNELCNNLFLTKYLVKNKDFFLKKKLYFDINMVLNFFLFLNLYLK